MKEGKMKEGKGGAITVYRDFPSGPVVKTHIDNAGGTDSIPSQGTKIPHATWPKSEKKKKNLSNMKFIHTLPVGLH